MLSTEALHAFKPAPQTYAWACGGWTAPPDRTALLAAHSWDVRGRPAGLVGALATRLEGRQSEVMLRPHVIAERLDDTVIRLLNLPA